MAYTSSNFKDSGNKIKFDVSSTSVVDKIQDYGQARVGRGFISRFGTLSVYKGQDLLITWAHVLLILSPFSFLLMASLNRRE